MTRRITTTDIRRDFTGILDRLARRSDRIILQRRGKDIAVLMPMKELRLFEDLIERIEDRLDMDAAKQAWIEQGDEPPASWEEVKERLRGK